MNLKTDTPATRRYLERAQAVLPELVREVVTICQIPAPTNQEERRTGYVYERMTALGLDGVAADEVGNVVGRMRGKGTGPVVLVAAHIDTVFPLDTDLTLEEDGDILRAPGVGDNSASVATMLFAAGLLKEADSRLDGDVLFAATVGEEGLGNLRGIRRVMEQYGREIDYVVAIDGSLGSMVRQAVGSRRFRLVVTAEGGHSWGAFGAPSAIHGLGRMIASIADIRVPANPKTTFNVGTISGGTSVNTIAARAEAVIDLRSLEIEELRRLEEKVRRIVTDVSRSSGVTATMDLIGDRPAGSVPEEHPLCQAVKQVHQQLGMQTRCYPSSTDGNVPVSMGYPTVTVGVTLGGNGHRTDEYIHTTPLAKGLAQLALLLLEVQKLPHRLR